MDTVYWPERISVNPEIMGGVPCVSGTRIPVATILEHIAQGESAEDLVRDYPRLNFEGIQAALVYAAEVVTDTHFAVA